MVKILEVVKIDNNRFRVWFMSPRMGQEVYQDIPANDELDAYFVVLKYLENITMLGVSNGYNQA
jgi:hypothetical protein